MLINIVKVLDVTPDVVKQGGKTGTYTAIEFSFKDLSNNKPFTKNVYQRNGDPTSDGIKALVTGDFAKLTMVKKEAPDGKSFYNITGVEKIAASAVKAELAQKAAGGGNYAQGKGGQSFADNALGQQVGNALTNAVALMCANHSEVKGKSFIDAARYVICTGERLKQELKGEAPPPKQEEKPTAKTTAKKPAPKEEPETEYVDVPDEEVNY